MGTFSESSAAARGRGIGVAAGLPFLVAAAGWLALFAVSLAAAGPARAADATTEPFVPGRHVYDHGKILSTHSADTAETLAARIEAAGGGRVAIYTVPDSTDLPDRTQLAADWQVDGLLMTDEGDWGAMVMGPTLAAKLTTDQQDAIETSPGMSTSESWMLGSLARIDAFLSGSHVFDGAGVLDAAGKQKAESAAKNLGGKIGGQVYVDIALGGDDAETTAFFNGAHLDGHFGKALVVALGVTDMQVGGYIGYDSDLYDSFHTVAPWSSSTLANQSVAADPQASVLDAIDAVQAGSLFNSNAAGDILPWIVFAIVIVILSITAPFLWGPWLIRRLTGAVEPINGGVPTSAVIQSIADTGMTVSMPSVGPDAPEYKLGLLVTPPGGSGTPYSVEIKAIIPRIFVPMILPGATVGVLVDSADPMRVSPDWENFNNPGGRTAALAGIDQAFAAAGAPGINLTFDAAGNPNLSQLTAFAGAVNAGQLPTHTGSAAQLLATGTHGTAIVTTAMPLGRTVRQINPSADISTLDDPLWMFTVEVTLAGQTPFPAVFGHRVPREKAALIGPGTRLAVAVNPANRNQEVAIDWNQSPMIS